MLQFDDGSKKEGVPEIEAIKTFEYNMQEVASNVVITEKTEKQHSRQIIYARGIF